MAIEVVSRDSNNAPKTEVSEQAESTEQTEAVVEETTDESESKEVSETSKEESEAEDVESEPEDEEQDDEEESEEKEKGKVPKGVKKRFNRFKRKLSEKDQEIDYWKREALKQKQAPESDDTPKSTKEQTVSEGKPKADDFETHEDFVEALTDWKLEQREKVKEAKNKEVQAKTEFEKKVDSFRQKSAEFAKANSDFEELVEDANDIPMSVAVQEALLRSDEGPALMYELIKDKLEYKRICSLDAISAAMEIGRIKAKLSDSSKTKKTKSTTTKAPPPPTPVGRGSEKAVKRSIYDPKLSFSDYERLRREQEKDRQF